MLLLQQGEEQKDLLSTASLDGTIRLWDLSQAPPRELNVLRGHERGVERLAATTVARRRSATRCGRERNTALFGGWGLRGVASAQQPLCVICAVGPRGAALCA